MSETSFMVCYKELLWSEKSRNKELVMVDKWSNLKSWLIKVF